MCDRCAVCGLKFQREEGYFLGAMYISFGLALVTIALIAVLLWGHHRLVDHQRYDLGSGVIPAARAGHLALCPRALDLSGPDFRP